MLAQTKTNITVKNIISNEAGLSPMSRKTMLMDTGMQKICNNTYAVCWLNFLGSDTALDCSKLVMTPCPRGKKYNYMFVPNKEQPFYDYSNVNECASCSVHIHFIPSCHGNKVTQCKDFKEKVISMEQGYATLKVLSEV